MKVLFLLLSVLVLISCQQKTTNQLLPGNWLFELQISEDDPELTIPFNVKVTNAKKLIIRNADESIAVSEITYSTDSVYIKIPVFGSEFKGKISGKLITGLYYNYNKVKVLPIPFVARHGILERFKKPASSGADLSGKWQVLFGSSDNPSPAIGIFKHNQQILSGTFQTETGDYRFLEGVVNDNKMQLSCFDGAHAFLFTATLENDQLNGMFYSGNTWKQNWVAQKTDDPELGDMKTLTFLKAGYDKFSFSFPNVDGKLVSLDDAPYQNKVVLVQIFGTWCPNCMDETRYLVELYKKHHSQGLEIIGLDYETKTDFDYFKKRITRFRNDLNVPYELLLAGPANKKLAAETLPMLNKVISYPTAVFIDKQGSVREIHTGFSGPGTGDDYVLYKQKTEQLIEELLNE